MTTPTPFPNAVFAGRSALIVEDNPFMRRLVRSLDREAAQRAHAHRPRPSLAGARRRRLTDRIGRCVRGGSGRGRIRG